MGQRLNIELKKNDKTLANAYYHWSGYSCVALEMTNDILDFIKNNPININETLYAIRVLESTGAGLTSFQPTEEDIESAKKFYKPEYFEEWISQKGELESAQELFPNEKFKECSGRNDGLLSITDYGIENTRKWEEGRVTIDIESGLVDFDVIWEFDFDDFDGTPEGKKVDFCLTNMNREQLDKLFETYKKYVDGEFNYIELNDGRKISFIY